MPRARSCFHGLIEFARARLHLLEQPNVLDCDHCLVGKGRDQLDLFVGEWLDIRLQDGDDPEERVLAQHRNREHGPVTLLLHQIDVFIIGLLQNIMAMDCLPLRGGPPRNGARTGPGWMLLQGLHECRRSPVRGGKTEILAVESENMTPRRSAQPRGAFDEGV